MCKINKIKIINNNILQCESVMGKKIKKNVLDSAGFTLVELLVAFAIITTSMVAIFSLIIQNIQVQKVNKDLLTASMLAQEGVELVRSIRDETWLEDPVLPALPPDTWDYLADLYNNNDFIVDYKNFAQEAENTGNSLTITDDPATRLYLDSDGFYNHDSTSPNTPTQFYRMIKIVNGPDSDGDGTYDYISIVSRVEWLNKEHVKNYIVEALLYDWR